MRQTLLTLFILWALLPRSIAIALPIVTAPEAHSLERLAASEVAHFLGRLYPDEQFNPVSAAPAEGDYIAIGAACAGVRPPRRRDSYRVDTVSHDGRTIGCIVGGDPRGALYGVYGLLDELGFGFYLSYTAEPEPRAGPFTFDAWKLEDRPLFAERFVFDWHNFLSSASTWNYTDWTRYIDQTARMRYGGIMVHAYGNNPMFAFHHNGLEKPVGYLTTTRSGRDWGTEHVNDVRRLYGAGGVFHKPVFGAAAAMVPETERVAAATRLMRRVFDYAASRGLDISFAVDVDTLPANPQQIIRTLPLPSRFRSGEAWLPIPDSPAGGAYFDDLFGQLLATYPQIDQVVIWYRRGRTPWLTLTPATLPPNWRRNFEEAIARRPELRENKYAAPMFAIGRIVERLGRLLDRTGRSGVEIATGTWDFDSLRAADAFFPRRAKLMALDWSIEFETGKVQSIIRAVSRNRRMTPIIWAHHDDHTYIGRPYTPFRKLAARLAAGGAHGVGIIHWTTRPLDLYFTSTSRQLWQASKDEPLDDTCRRTALRTFGPQAAETGAAYLMKWIVEAPMFGRETTDRFIDRPLTGTRRVALLSRERRHILERIDHHELTGTGLDRWSYFREYERFIEQFFTTQHTLDRGEVAGTARERPEAAIEQYATAARQGEISRGEMALLISLNLRWLPYFHAQRQLLGLQPVRVNFQPTRHDPLAQGAGHNTFFFDRQRNIWAGLGKKETGLPTWTGSPLPQVPAGYDPGLFTSGIEISKPAALDLSALTGAPLRPGSYTVELFFLNSATTPKSVIRTKQIATSSAGKVTIRLQPASGRTKLCALTIQTPPLPTQ